MIFRKVRCGSPSAPLRQPVLLQYLQNWLQILALVRVKRSWVGPQHLQRPHPSRAHLCVSPGASNTFNRIYKTVITSPARDRGCVVRSAGPAVDRVDEATRTMSCSAPRGMSSRCQCHWWRYFNLKISYSDTVTYLRQFSNKKQRFVGVHTKDLRWQVATPEPLLSH